MSRTRGTFRSACWVKGLFKMPTFRNFTLVLLASALLINVSRVISTQCNTMDSVSGHVLKNHVIKSTRTNDVSDCLEQCRKEVTCQSINYYSTSVCELNSKTKELREKDFKRDQTGYYVQNPHAEKVGSSKHNAPSTCGDIKKSNPSSCSGSYWLDKNADGNPTQAICYMNLTHAAISSCKAMTVAGSCCVFPFTYKGVSYDSCTDVNTDPKKKWCSLKSVYDSSSWDYCAHCSTCTTKDGFCCVFPFRYKGKTYDSCTDFELAKGRYWCSLTSDYSGRWGYCAN